MHPRKGRHNVLTMVTVFLSISRKKQRFKSSLYHRRFCLEMLNYGGHGYVIAACFNHVIGGSLTQ